MERGRSRVRTTCFMSSLQRLGVVFEFVVVVGFAVEAAVFFERLRLLESVDRHLGFDGLIIVALEHGDVRLALAFDLGDAFRLLRVSVGSAKGFVSAAQGCLEKSGLPMTCQKFVSPKAACASITRVSSDGKLAIKECRLRRLITNRECSEQCLELEDGFIGLARVGERKLWR
jgi:hypothetical protein